MSESEIERVYGPTVGYKIITDRIKKYRKEIIAEWEARKKQQEIETGGPVETTEPREELKQLLIKEYSDFKKAADVPVFTLGIRVAKKKDDKASAFGALNYAFGWLDAGKNIGLFKIKK